MKKTIAFLSLFTSLSTLICCALPALFVVLGFGAAFAGIVGNVPQLIWISENKLQIFGVGGVLLILGGFLQWQARNQACPIDPKLAASCSTTRDWSLPLYYGSVVTYLIGAFFAFILPTLV